MIVKNLRHRLKLFWQSARLIRRYDVLVERGVTIKYADSMSFGRHCTLQSGAYLYGSRSHRPVRFGDYVVVAGGCMVLGEGGLEIGDFTHLGPHVVLTTQYGDSASDMCRPDPQVKYLPVTVGRGCWIGAGAVIMPGTVLGDRCIVAPNSVVFGLWPAGRRLAGNPARAERRDRP
jgi:acetyltransferase-like isoleucine patch superfamily enzyme